MTLHKMTPDGDQFDNQHPVVPVPDETEEHDQLRVITLPDNTESVAVLTAKLQKYKARFKNERSAHRYQPPEVFDTYYKIFVLERLLETGSVNSLELGRELATLHGGDIARPDYFKQAFDVIEDYVLTGGANTRGGTGLR